MSCLSRNISRREDVSKIEVDGGMRSGSRDYGDSSGSLKRLGSHDGEMEVKGEEDLGAGKERVIMVRRALLEVSCLGNWQRQQEILKEMNLIGEGGFGRVYKRKPETGEVAAIRQLSHDGLQGFQEVMAEVLMLSLLSNLNLVTLHG